MKNKHLSRSTISRKNGFTVIELVIVIAIIAILAAVAIPTFAGVIKDAQVSAKIQTAENINKLLIIDEISNDKPLCMQDALAILSDSGFGYADFSVENGMLIIWSRKENRVAVVDTNMKDVYTNDREALPADKLDFWQVTSEIPEEYNTSLYLTDAFLDSTVEIGTGIDLGTNTNVKEVIYEDSDEKEKQTLIRTNSNDCAVSISNLSDTVEVLGLAKLITTSSANGKDLNRLDIYSKVDELDIESGNVVLKSGAYSELISIPITNPDTLVITEGSGYLRIEGDIFSLTIEDGAYFGKIFDAEEKEIDLSINDPSEDPDESENESEGGDTPDDGEEDQPSKYPFEIFDTSKLDYSKNTEVYLYDLTIENEDERYMSLKSATLRGGYAVVLKDLNDNDTFYNVCVSTSLILDLNGKELLNYSSGSSVQDVFSILIKNGGNLTVIDTSTEQKGSITTSLEGNSNIEILSGGVLTIYDGEFSGILGAIYMREGATATINGGSFTHLNDGSPIIIAENSTLTINGGDFYTEGESKPMIYIGASAKKSTITINGGTFGGNIVSAEFESLVTDNRTSE